MAVKLQKYCVAKSSKLRPSSDITRREIKLTTSYYNTTLIVAFARGVGARNALLVCLSG